MRPLRIFILEDQIITQEALRECLEGLGYEVVGLADSAKEGLELIRRTEPDLAILDIKVNGPHSGTWLGEQLSIPFIYLTAYNDQDTLQKALKTRPSSYLVKPFKKEQVFASIELAISNAQVGGAEADNNKDQLIQVSDKIVIKVGHTYHTVQLDEVLFIKADGKYIELHTDERRFVQRNSLVQFLRDFPRDYWIQTHRSYIVNARSILSYTHAEVTVSGGAVLPLSRNYKDRFEDRASS